MTQTPLIVELPTTDHAPKPCRRCGVPGPFGQGRSYCDGCRPLAQSKPCLSCGENFNRPVGLSNDGWSRRQFCSCQCRESQVHPDRGYVVEDNGYVSPCWVWEGSLNNQGYARRGDKYVHRANYERDVGPIPDGFEIDHLCRVRACVNPAHLEPVTHAENVRRGTSPAARQAERDRCVNGHLLAGSNLYLVNGSRRQCKACNRLRARKAREEGRAPFDPKGTLPWAQRPSRNPGLAAQMEEMWSAGLGLRVIASEVGLTRAGVRYHLKKRGLYDAEKAVA